MAYNYGLLSVNYGLLYGIVTAYYHDYGLLWLIYGLLYGIVACDFRLLGVPGTIIAIVLVYEVMQDVYHQAYLPFHGRGGGADAAAGPDGDGVAGWGGGSSASCSAGTDPFGGSVFGGI